MAVEKCCICKKEEQTKWMIYRGGKPYCDDIKCLKKIPKKHVHDLNL